MEDLKNKTKKSRESKGGGELWSPGGDVHWWVATELERFGFIFPKWFQGQKEGTRVEREDELPRVQALTYIGGWFVKTCLLLEG